MLNCIGYKICTRIFSWMRFPFFFLSLPLLLFRILYTIYNIRNDTWNEMSFRIVCNFDRFSFFFALIRLLFVFPSFPLFAVVQLVPQRERERAQRNTASWLREIDNRIAYCTLELSERNTI